MEVTSIGVVGAGKMGNGIVLSAVMAGYDVTLQNRTKENLWKAKEIIEKQLDKMAEKGKIAAADADAAKQKISYTRTFEGFEEIDFVIEVVAESVDIKKDVFGKLDALCKKDAVLVSSTSTFSITMIAAATQRPAQVAGMHFFIEPTKLVEITRGYYTSDETVETIKAVVKKMNKVGVELKKDSPGFIANRVYTPLFLEAFKIYAEGIASKEDIDLAMKASYLPIGPFELADIIGLDVLMSGLEYYQGQLGEQWLAPVSLKQLVTAGRLGKKTGKGWYDY